MSPARQRMVGHAVAYAIAYSLLFAVMLLKGAALRLNPAGWYVALGVMLMPTFVLVRWLTRAARPIGETITGLVANTSGLIGFFALAHMQAGVADQPGPIAFSKALYFSIVTWTTLGYGDVHPIATLELLAAFEALIGYLYLSLLVAVLTKALKL